MRHTLQPHAMYDAMHAFSDEFSVSVIDGIYLSA